MAQLTVFNSVSLDGYFTDENNDMSWAHRGDDAEWNAFTNENASGGGLLVFGRVTYQMMAGYWTTDAARKAMPAVADAMNNMPKLVFSRSLLQANWSNTRLVSSDPVAEVKRLRAGSGPDMAIMGSGTIVALVAATRQIDLLTLVTVPIALGAGRALFGGAKEKLTYKLSSSRAFKNGNVVNNYVQA